MGMQKYRADKAESPAPNGGVAWYADWMRGPSLAKIVNCPIDETELRRTVYITGEADTWFSQPAVCKVRGKRVVGYVTGTEDGFVFRVMDSHAHIVGLRRNVDRDLHNPDYDK